MSVRTNIFYVKKEDEFIRHQELIFLVDKPTYRHSNEGEVIRERGIQEFRFNVSEKAFDQMMIVLSTLQNVEESELK